MGNNEEKEENNRKLVDVEKQEARLETLIAIFLAITALLTAWATWIGSLHGGNMSTNYTKSNNSSVEGNSMFNEATQNVMQDMLLWNEITDLQIELQYADSEEDIETRDLAAYKLYYKCFDNLSEAMAEEIGWDFKAAEAYSEKPVDYILQWLTDEKSTMSPFSNQEYTNHYYIDSQDVIAESTEYLEEGQKDNTKGDTFNLVTVFYSVVLFLLGIAGTFKRLPNRKVVVFASIALMLVATVYMFTIPMPTGFDFASFFVK